MYKESLIAIKEAMAVAGKEDRPKLIYMADVFSSLTFLSLSTFLHQDRLYRHCQFEDA